MSHGKELPKVVDKSQADIDDAIAAIQGSDIPVGIKEFAISCIRLAVWLPKALLEHKIKLSNLRKLIFGIGKKDKKKKQEDNNNSEKKSQPESSAGLPTTQPLEPIEYGAMVGGILTSVIYTCALAGENPLAYLTALQEYKSQVFKEPERWLPWNYQDNLSSSLSSAA